jgi:polyhydroxyalkanoate synthesis regulator phasin
MLLTNSEAAQFWPLYDRYRAEREKLGDRKVRLITDFLAKRDSMSEEDAENLIDEAMSIDNDKNEVKEKYVAKMMKVLSARTVARFFQIDQKLDAVVDMELAARIPLIH